MKKIYFPFFLILAFTCSLFFPLHVKAADLTFSPSNKVVPRGVSFTLDVYISNNTQSTNAVSGKIAFPRELLSVTSLSKSGSIVNMWASEPTYSNTEGTIDFEGVILNPGFSGSRGKVLTIRFSSKKEGVAQVSFASGSVLANDGEATNILDSLGTATIVIGEGTPLAEDTNPTPSVTTEKTSSINAPQVVSSTHPDQNKWYRNASPIFSWMVPAGVTSMRISFDKSPSSTPSKVYTPAISEKEIGEVGSGQYYFHAQFRNASGWGKVTHYQFQIDTTKPEPINIAFPEGNESTNPQVAINFKTTDTYSGLDRYEIKINGAQTIAIPAEGFSNQYILPPQPTGRHIVQVSAIDKAGNSTSNAAELVIIPIDVPVITEYTADFVKGELFRAKGSTYPNATINVFLTNKKDKEVFKAATSNAEGLFELEWIPEIKAGQYTLSAQVIDSRNVRSDRSQGMPVVVHRGAFLSVQWQQVYKYLPYLLAILFFALALYYFIRYRLLRNKLKRGISDVEDVVQNDLALLHKNIVTQIKLLSSRGGKHKITKEEAIKSNQDNIDLIERDVKHKLDVIKKKLFKNK